ncbi:sugar nucleotide-binding protein [Pseudoduganella lurida]
MSSGIPHLIFRTSWVYDMRDNNFPLTTVRLAKEGGNQHGVLS